MPSINQAKLLTNKTTDSVPGLGLKGTAQSYIFNAEKKARGEEFPYDANGEALYIRWSDTLREWVNDSISAGTQYSNYNLIFNRKEQESGQEGNNTYWVANHTDLNERMRVRWLKDKITDEFMWIQTDTSNNPIFPQANKAYRWINNAWVIVDFSL